MIRSRDLKPSDVIQSIVVGKITARHTLPATHCPFPAHILDALCSWVGVHLHTLSGVCLLQTVDTMVATTNLALATGQRDVHEAACV